MMNGRSVGIGFLGLLIGAGIALWSIGSHGVATGTWGPHMMFGSWGMMGFFWIFPLLGFVVIVTVVTLLMRGLMPTISQSSWSPYAGPDPATPQASSVTGTATCGQCGKRVEDDWLVCPYCGKQLAQRAIVSSTIR